MILRFLPYFCIATLLVAPLVLSDYAITLLDQVALSSLPVLGLVLLTGIGGMTSFAQAAFVGIGAYSTAYLTTSLGLSPWVALLAGLLINGAAALLLGGISLTLSGHNLPVATIAWGLAVFYFFSSAEFIGAHDGITGLPPIEILGLSLNNAHILSYLIWTVVIASLVLVRNLLDSRSGRALRTLKGRTLMAESFGIDTNRYKLILFLIAAELASISGWLYAHLVRFVNPTPFGLEWSLNYLFMSVLGGTAQMWGAIAGSAIMTLSLQWLRELLPQLIGQPGNFEVIVFGLILLVLMQRTGDGLTDFIARFRSDRRKRKADETPTEPADATASRIETLRLPLRHGEARAKTDAPPLLTVKEITKTFGGLTAADRVSLDVRPGELVGLIGPNGAGKSTTFAMISGLLKPDGGEISFDGKAITGMKPRRVVGLGIARSFQHALLLNDRTVLENAMLGAHMQGSAGVVRSALRLDRAEEEKLRAEAIFQLNRIGLGDRLEELAGNLPLGQQRVLEIARALSARPRLLLLDEPAAGLRHQEKKALAALLRRLCDDGLGLLLVEHDMDFVMGLVDRLVVMEAGAVIASGLPRDVRRNPAVLHAYLGGIDDWVA